MAVVTGPVVCIAVALVRVGALARPLTPHAPRLSLCGEEVCMGTIELRVDGMSCGGCENAVRNVVGALDNVRSVSADHATGQVTIEAAGPVDLEVVRRAIEGAGFSVPA